MLSGPGGVLAHQEFHRALLLGTVHEAAQYLVFVEMSAAVEASGQIEGSGMSLVRLSDSARAI